MTRKMQLRIQVERAVSPEEALGVEDTAELNMFTNTLKKEMEKRTSDVSCWNFDVIS